MNSDVRPWLFAYRLSNRLVAAGQQIRRMAHGFGNRISIVLLAANVGELIDGGIMAGLEVAGLAAEDGLGFASLTEDAVRAAAPGATLVFFRVRPFGFVIPLVGVAVGALESGHASSRLVGLMEVGPKQP